MKGYGYGRTPDSIHDRRNSRCTTPPPPIPKCLDHGIPPSKRAWPLQYLLLSILKPYAYLRTSTSHSEFQVIQVVSRTVVTVEIPRSLIFSCSATYIRMFSFSSPLVSTFICLTTLVSLVSSHTVITYPGWRGDNLKNSGDPITDHGLGVGANGTYPYGMQWIYPCTQQLPSTA